MTNGNAHGAVQQVAHLRGHACLVDKSASDIAEHRDQIDFLLIVATNRRACLLARDGKHRHVVHSCVVQPGNEVRGTRARRGNADTKLSGELGVRSRHERSHLFMARLDELDLAAGPCQRTKHAIDAVAGVSVNATHTPRMEPFDQEIADCMVAPWSSDRLGGLSGQRLFALRHRRLQRA